MPSPNISTYFCDQVISITGLRLPTLSINRHGMVSFGCIRVHITKLDTVTEAEQRASGGQNAVDWWSRWSTVIPAFFEAALAEMDEYWGNQEQSVREADFALLPNEPDMPQIQTLYDTASVSRNEAEEKQFINIFGVESASEVPSE